MLTATTRTRRLTEATLASAAALALVGVACGSDDDDASGTNTTSDSTTTSASTSTSTSASASTTVADRAPTTSGAASANGGSDGRLAVSEQLIDAFYSYDENALTPLLDGVDGAEFVAYYQGWAQGANYGVLDRLPCEDDGGSVMCPITVEDDLLKTLGIDFNVTDTFIIVFDEADDMAEISTTSNDPPTVGEAFEWTFANKPELMEGACAGFFDGGPTPGECAASVVASFEEFALEQESGAE